jgi:LuxR family maltose regulon positive regulatory protein
LTTARLEHARGSANTELVGAEPDTKDPIETKFYVPRSRRALVPRPRLSDRLDRGGASKLTLVSAPAGFGKTTLLGEWLAAGPAAPSDERSGAWLSLDQGDNDPVSFWTYLVAALQTVAPGVGASALALLQERHTSQASRSLVHRSAAPEP